MQKFSISEKKGIKFEKSRVWAWFFENHKHTPLCRISGIWLWCNLTEKNIRLTGISIYLLKWKNRHLWGIVE